MAIAAAGAATAGIVALWGRIKGEDGKSGESNEKATQTGQSEQPAQAPSS